jgi:hypothetical protein
VFAHELASRGRITSAIYGRGDFMLKAVGWIVLIIFIIGLLVVLGVFKAIF